MGRECVRRNCTLKKTRLKNGWTRNKRRLVSDSLLNVELHVGNERINTI